MTVRHGRTNFSLHVHVLICLAQSARSTAVQDTVAGCSCSHTHNLSVTHLRKATTKSSARSPRITMSASKYISLLRNAPSDESCCCNRNDEPTIRWLLHFLPSLTVVRRHKKAECGGHTISLSKCLAWGPQVLDMLMWAQVPICQPCSMAHSW